MGGRTCGENVGAAPSGRGFGTREKGWGFFKEDLVRLGATRPRNDARPRRWQSKRPGQISYCKKY